MYSEDECLALSGIQHIAFCERQWALIHVERLWAENALTVLGDIVHERAHDSSLRERRGGKLIVRGLNVRSAELGLSGTCDVAEFHESSDGVPIHGEGGLWSILPIEYKRGKRKVHDADRLQLCAQAMCLEEMFCAEVPRGALYYNETHSREVVDFVPELREAVRRHAERMHDLLARRHTPKAARKAHCRSCSLKHLCVPETQGKESMAAYTERKLRELT